MNLQYVPVKKEHVKEDNPHAFTVEVGERLRKSGVMCYLQITRDMHGTRRMTAVIKEEDVGSLMVALYPNDHRFKVTTLTEVQRLWLKDNMPGVFKQEIRDGRYDAKTYLFFSSETDAIKFALAVG